MPMWLSVGCLVVVLLCWLDSAAEGLLGKKLGGGVRVLAAFIGASVLFVTLADTVSGCKEPRQPMFARALTEQRINTILEDQYVRAVTGERERLRIDIRLIDDRK